jgi:hypothetical protein
MAVRSRTCSFAGGYRRFAEFPVTQGEPHLKHRAQSAL